MEAPDGTEVDVTVCATEFGFCHVTELLTPITSVMLSGLKNKSETSAPSVRLLFALQPEGGVGASVGTVTVTLLREAEEDVVEEGAPELAEK